MRGFVKNILLLAIFIVLFCLSQLAVGIVALKLNGGVVTDFSYMCVYFFSMLVCYLVASFIERQTFGRITPIDNSKRGFNPVTILTGVILLVAISIALTPLAEMLPADSRSFPEGTFTLISIVILAPIFEEMIFRGRLYNIFHHNGSPLTSASLSALAFGIVHLEPIVIIEALIVGVVFSYFYIVRRSIIAPIILHMCNNALAYALLVLSYRDESLLNLFGEGLAPTIAYIVSVLIIILSAVIIIRRLLIERRNERRVVPDEEEIDE
ncbi:MAG: CPBP family intramembrane metalloprotease [Alistipes sp.]|nr:CPBP family intramembrane metalloprotease [Alistipes sp.]